MNRTRAAAGATALVAAAALWAAGCGGSSGESDTAQADPGAATSAPAADESDGTATEDESGYGTGSGDGSGAGDGTGSGDGSGAGDGTGSGDGSGAGDGTGSGDGSGARAEAQPVTELIAGAEPLVVSFIVTDVSMVAAALGWEVPDQGDLEAAIEALVAHANDNGGVAGHAIEPVVQVFNAITDSPISEEQLCNAITQDDRAHVVVLTGQFQDNARPCYAAAGTMMLDVTLFPVDRAGYEELAPYLWSPLLPSYDQLVGGLADALEAENWYDGAVVGIIGIDNDMNRRINEQVLLPRLAGAGTEAAAINWVDPADGTTLEAGLQQAILDFKSADVDKVIAVGGSRLLPWLIDIAATQNFEPAYALTSYDSPEFNMRNTPDLMAGSLGITVLPGWDVTDDQHPSPANDAEAECLDVLADADITFESRANSRSALLYCDAVRMLQHAGQHAASMSPDDMGSAMWAVGDAFESASVYAVAFSEGSYTGSAGYRVFAFDDACSCMVMRSDTIPFRE